MSQDQKKKTLYHSELSRMGKVSVRVMSDVMKSKFEGKPPYVFLEIDGTERVYSTENDQCAEALAGLRDKLVTLQARSSRETATIEVSDASPVFQGKPQSPLNRPPLERAESFEEQKAREARAFVEATRYAAKLRVLFEICYTHARMVIKEEDFPNLTEEALEDLRLRATNSLMIPAEKKIVINDLPAAWPTTLEQKNKQEAKDDGGKSADTAADEDWPLPERSTSPAPETD